MKIYLYRVKQEVPARDGKPAYPKYLWRWQMVHRNGAILAVSQLYRNRQTVEKALKQVRDELAVAPVEVIMEV